MSSVYQERPYQREAIDAARARLAAGDRSALLWLATGLGKMVIAGSILRGTVAKGKRGLFLAHREELLDQCVEKLAGFGVEARVEQGKRRAGHAQVVVASVASLQRGRLDSIAPETIATAVVDEAHHAPAKTYTSILDRLVAARIIGLTASPWRLDNKPLSKIFASVAYRYDLRKAITDGWLAPITARRIVVDAIDLSEVSAKGAADLNQEQLAEVMNRARAVRGVVEAVLREAGDRKTILFAVDVAHAQALAELLNEAQPGSALVVHGEMDRDARKAALAAYTYGDVQFLANVDVLTEGFDAPITSCIVNARPTKSLTRIVQSIGRGTRKHPGKTDCLVLDVTGSVGKHSLVGPADCLAGAKVDDEVRAELERLLEGGTRNVGEALDEATAAAAARRDALARDASIRFHAERIDPFIGRDTQPAPERSREKPSDRQIRDLEKLGVKKLPDGIDFLEADRLIVRLIARRRQGLCTLGQARQLTRYGIDPREVKYADATRLMIALQKAEWPDPRTDIEKVSKLLEAWRSGEEPSAAPANDASDLDLQWGAA